MYVAMTRAKQSLTLLAPLRFYVTQQRKDGDKHVYGSRSRFMTDELLETMRQDWHGREEAIASRRIGGSERRLDVAQRMREMW